MTQITRRAFQTSLIGGAAAWLSGCQGTPKNQLLHVSYDATRELYRKLNRQYLDHLARMSTPEQLEGALRIRMSHGGSTSQARSVRDGLEADVISFALESDIDACADKKLLPKNWRERLPNHSLPYVSTIVMVVRKGNPHGIRDWADLTRKNVQIITPSPKTGGGAKLSVLALWGAALENKQDPETFLREVVRRVPVFDSGSRGSAITFARRGIGDVHLTWENEAILEERECPGEMEIIYPSLSYRAQPPVAWVDANTDKHGSREIAETYLRYLYSSEAQKVIAENGYRPTDPQVAQAFSDRYPALKLFTWQDLGFSSWEDVHKQIFADGALFDKLTESV